MSVCVLVWTQTSLRLQTLKTGTRTNYRGEGAKKRERLRESEPEGASQGVATVPTHTRCNTHFHKPTYPAQ